MPCSCACHPLRRPGVPGIVLPTPLPSAALDVYQATASCFGMPENAHPVICERSRCHARGDAPSWLRMEGIPRGLSAAYARGHGEESDCCMRAITA